MLENKGPPLVGYDHTQLELGPLCKYGKYGLKGVIFPIDLKLNQCVFSHGDMTFPLIHYKYMKPIGKVKSQVITFVFMCRKTNSFLSFSLFLPHVHLLYIVVRFQLVIRLRVGTRSS